MSTPAIDIDQALRDPNLLGAVLGNQASWQTWRAVLKAAFGLGLNRDEAHAFASVAGNRAPPQQRVRELWAVVGRRAGKSRMAAAIAVYLARFVKHKLAPGEIGMVLVLAASTDQARVVFGYAKAFLESSPVLRKEIAEVTRSEIRLKNGIIIAIHSNSFRTIRGRTLVACIFDEVAAWRDETSATPDIETYRSVMPAMLTTKGMLIGISTGYRRIGLLYQKHRDCFGQDNPDTLVVQGETQAFNNTVDAADIAAQIAADPAAAVSEWGGGFRDDMAALFDDAFIDRAIDYDRPLELPPMQYNFQNPLIYQGFTDVSGGRGDSYSIGIGHKQLPSDFLITDVCRAAKPPFDPMQVTEEYAKLCREYRIARIVGDFYGAEWVASAWQKFGITYVRSPLTKSEIYLECLPLFTRGLVRIPDHPTLIRELRLLERHTHRSGKDDIGHGKNGHDDCSDVVCGVLRMLGDYNGYDIHNFERVDGRDPNHGPSTWSRGARLSQYIRANMPVSATRDRMIDWSRM
jgi:Phage Terminase